MRSFWVRDGKRLALSAALMLIVAARSGLALDKPTGAPLALSGIETEQPIPLAILTPDGKKAKCVPVRIHWNPKQDVGPNDEATSFSLDIKPDAPGASIFTAQLWSASLASALAWQQPWSGARWKILDTPACDGSGIDAALAVGLISTSARRLYPKDTVVIGSLNPDGSLGAVPHLAERIDAAADAGMKRVIIPNSQRFETDASGQVLNIVRHATDLRLQCIPVDNLVDATETTMNDPLPESTVDDSAPKYSDEVTAYIDGFAHREQTEFDDGLRFAPKEADLAGYPLYLAAVWRQAFAQGEAGRQAYKAGHVYVAYRLFAEANGRMHGANALDLQANQAAFDVKTTLAESDQLRGQLRDLMNPPSVDKRELESAILVAEMADWAYGLNASLEGAQLVTKQAYSQRSDATPAQRTRAREEILFAIDQAKYLLHQADFYQGLLDHVGNNNPLPVDENAKHLLPQLIPAQLATAQLFTAGILPRANEMRDGLLFDPRLAAYVNVLRDIKAAWDASKRGQEIEQESGAAGAVTPPPAPGAKPPDTSTDNATKLNSSSTNTSVGFDPGNTYAAPHTLLAPSAPVKKVSDVAACLIWANHDCEIATLDEKYLWLGGVVDPVTHEWHAKDRAKLDFLIQTSELGARHGIAFAAKAEMDPSVLAMIYERASYDRPQGDDASTLESLRNYWRCALLGNMCWQLAHTRKAQPVDLAATPPAKSEAKTDQTNAAKPGTAASSSKTTKPTAETASTKNSQPASTPAQAPATAATTNTAPATHAPAIAATTNTAPSTHAPAIAASTNTTPAIPAPATAATTNTAPAAHAPAIAATTNTAPATHAPATVATTNTTSAAWTATTGQATTNEANIPTAPIANHSVTAQDPPVAHIAKPEDYNGPSANSSTNAPPAPVPAPAPATPASTAGGATNSEANIPVAPIAKPEDYNGPTGGNSTQSPPATNAAPDIGPPAPGASHGGGTLQ